MASKVRASVSSIFSKISTFLTDDEYFCDVVDIFVYKYVKIRRKLRKYRFYQFLFEEEIEANEL